MGGHYCPGCGAELVLRRGGFWGCARYRRGCRWTFRSNGAGAPVYTSVHEAEDLAPLILAAKDSLLAAAKWADLGRRYYPYVGAVLDTEDLLELGELRAELLERRRSG